MFLPQYALVIMGIGTVLTVLFIILLLMSGKYKELVKPLNEKEFPLHDLYTFGFLLLDLIQYKFTSKTNLKRKRDIELIHGTNYAIYYMKVIKAQQITLSTLVLLSSFILFGFVLDPLVLGIMFSFAIVTYYYFGTVVTERLKKRSAEMLNAFPNVVAELALLINAGMIMKEAWDVVAVQGEGEIFDQMKTTMADIENGTSEAEAYQTFGTNCVVPEIKKFSSTMVQGLLKGNRELAEMIKQQSGEVWKIKQHLVKQQGEKAASKLLIPILIMFIGILIMIIVPIFANL